MNRNDLTNANRAIDHFTRAAQLEAEDDKNIDQQTSGMVFCPPGYAVRKLTEEEKQSLEEMEKLSPVDRMLLRQGYEAIARYVELGGNPADLVRPLGNPNSDVPKPGTASVTDQPPKPGTGA